MADFGYKIIGSSSSGTLNHVCGSKYTLSEEGNATSITFHKAGGADANTKCAIYDSSRNFVEETEERYVSGVGWHTFNLNNSPVNLPAGDYILCVWSGESSEAASRDADVAVDRWWDEYAYDGWPASLAAPTRTGKFSIYCTYTPLVVATNMKINISDVFKDVSELKINIGDAWKNVNKIQQNIGDVWKTVFG